MQLRRWVDGLTVGCAVLIGWIGIEAQKPPRALGLDAPAEVFSAARAQKDVAAIAQVPHPMGSPEAEKVRLHLMTRLRALGLEPSVQGSSNDLNGAKNILARLKGTGPAGKKTLLLSAHYDSVAEGPGAGDNASGAAVVLETLRALQAGPPPVRDVIALFDDGEEVGFDGSVVFVKEHPWAKDVGLVLNFDARGNSGPSVMFETSDDNGWLIKQYAQAVSRPFATSLSMDVYRAMPNDTDLTIYKEAKLPGLNFAFGAGVAAYHTPGDTPAALNQDTLQHQGQNALETARWFAALDLDHTLAPDVVYFSLFSRAVVSYPIGVARLLAAMAASLYLFVAGWLVIRGAAIRDVATGAGLLLLAVLTSLVVMTVVFVIGNGYNIVQASFRRPAVPWVEYDLYILAGISLAAAATTVWLFQALGGSTNRLALCAGALFWWLVLSSAAMVYAPGSSYLFTLPLISTLVALGIMAVAPVDSPWRPVVALWGALPALILLVPLLRTTFDSLGLGMAGPITVLAVLSTAVMLPLVPQPTARATTRPRAEVAESIAN